MQQLSKIIVALVLCLIFMLLYKQNIGTINDISKQTKEIKLPDSEISFLNLYADDLLLIDNLRNLELDNSELILEQQLERGANYNRYIASYTSQGYKIYGLLTIPDGSGKYPAIVFNHGYIPPNQYKTTEKYVQYVDYLARNGYIVFKIDFRGHGNSEGSASGAYFSSAYTIDALNAKKALQTNDKVDNENIGIWGHSMSGNVTLKALLVNSGFKAGVIWAGAGYSFIDLAKYGINDNTYVGRNPDTESNEKKDGKLEERVINIVENSPYWQAASLKENLNYLESPLQLHHASNDEVVSINYSLDLAKALDGENKYYELYTYDNGGHNISGDAFNVAMQRTLIFFDKHLKKVE